MELSNKKMKEDGTRDMDDDTRAFDSSMFQSNQAENENISLPELGELNEKLSSLYNLLGKQQQQRGDIQGKMNASRESEEDVDDELLMSLELQQDILEENIVETLKNIQGVTRKLETVKEAEATVPEETVLPGRGEEEKDDPEASATFEDEDDAGLDELVSEMIETGTESLEEVEELFSETLDELTPGEAEVGIKVDETAHVEEPTEEKAEPEGEELFAQEPEPSVPEPSGPKLPSKPAPERRKGEEATRTSRPKLTRTLISEIEELSSTTTTIPAERERPRQRKRSGLETISLERLQKPRRKRLKVDLLKSATVLSFKKCTNCKAIVPANFKICGRCGETLKSICPICEARIPRGVEYCSNCNKRVMY